MLMAKNDSNGGCNCLFFLQVCAGIGISQCNRSCNDSPKDEVIDSLAIDIAVIGNDGALSSYDEELSEEDKTFLGNSLFTGEQPYVEYYGENYVCSQQQCSAIEVTAPVNSDIVVIIKRNNDNGSVMSHAYIEAGDKYTFDLPNGMFQPFFYYGEGWNPDKEMGNGVKGGFVKNESFSKDSPQRIDDCVLSYVLQLRKDGNFQTKRSNRDEMF